MKQLLDYFSRLGTKYNLNFSGQEILKDHILGLDGIQRKLLVLSGIRSGRLHDRIIDLNEVRSCSLKKYYGRILANELRSKKLEQYIEKVWLHIDFNTEKQGADILFYKQADQPIDELPNLEQKARRWKDLLSKLKPVQAKKAFPNKTCHHAQKKIHGVSTGYDRIARVAERHYNRESIHRRSCPV